MLEDAKEMSHEDVELAAWTGGAGGAAKDSAVFLHFSRLERLRCGLDKLNASMLELIEKTLAVSARAQDAEVVYAQALAQAAAKAGSSGSGSGSASTASSPAGSPAAGSSSSSPPASLETPAVPVPADLQMLRDKLRRLQHAKTTLAGRIAETEKTINAMAKLRDGNSR